MFHSVSTGPERHDYCLCPYCDESLEIDQGLLWEGETPRDIMAAIDITRNDHDCPEKEAERQLILSGTVNRLRLGEKS